MNYSGIISGLSGNQITINIKPDITLNPNGTFYPDYFEVQYKDNLSFNGTQMSFRDFLWLQEAIQRMVSVFPMLLQQNRYGMLRILPTPTEE
jgi:hypothetical protein